MRDDKGKKRFLVAPPACGGRLLGMTNNIPRACEIGTTLNKRTIFPSGSC